jgi:hypothetical protein
MPKGSSRGCELSFLVRNEGESGPGARPMKRELDDRTYDEYPNRTSRPVPERAECIASAEEFGRSLQASSLHPQ